MLLEHKANIEEVDKVQGYTPLLWACKSQDLHTVEVLLAAGADVDFRSAKTRESAEGMHLLSLICSNYHP